MTDNIEPGDLERLPGLFRGWDLPLLVRRGGVYRVEDGGEMADGTALFAVWSEPVAGEDRA